MVYAVGDRHDQRDACRALVSTATDGGIELHASVELVQEFLFHRLRRGNRALAVKQTRDVAALCVLHPFDTEVAGRMIDLVASAGIGGRNAVHAATALLHGFEALVSPDRGFDTVPGLLRIDPTALP
jgi:predicted nucleic acid-binding protein